MTDSSLVVLGGGNTAFSVAANLALAGARVTLCELAAFEHAVAPIADSRRIGLSGVGHQGTAQIECVTTDFRAALPQAKLLLVIVPSYGHRAFAEAIAPHLQPGHVIVVMPGNLGSLEFARILREHGSPAVVIAETDTAPYVCRKIAPSAAHIWGIVRGMGLGVLPAHETAHVRDRLGHWFPGIRPHPHVLACGLAAMNPVVHPAGVLLNAGRIEYSRGEFYFYEEGVTPAVVRLVEAVDRERLAIGHALGLDLVPVHEAFHAADFGPAGDLWATINGSRMLTQLRAPGAVETRWLTEDVPYGLATWALLGERLGVPCPRMRALVELASATLGQDFLASARTLADLGIDHLGPNELLGYVGLA